MPSSSWGYKNGIKWSSQLLQNVCACVHLCEVIFEKTGVFRTTLYAAYKMCAVSKMYLTNVQHELMTPHTHRDPIFYDLEEKITYFTHHGNEKQH
jgi:hypothetical protein